VAVRQCDTGNPDRDFARTAARCVGELDRSVTFPFALGDPAEAALDLGAKSWARIRASREPMVSGSPARTPGRPETVSEFIERIERIERTDSESYGMSSLLIIAWFGLIGFFFATAAVTVLRYRQPRPPSGEPLPRCSIILPIKGVSNFLEDNLRDLARLEPFRGEILVALASEQDPAFEIVAPIISEYPDKMKLLLGEAMEFANPKLRNVAKAYQASREDIILFVDDSVKLDADLYAEIIHGIKPGLAITAAPVATDAENFPAEIEAAICNGYLFRIEMFLNLFGIAAAFGNALAFRKQDLEAAGGIQRLTDGPCEDHALSEALRAAGGRLTQMPTGIRRRIGKRTWSEVFWRHLRWKKCTICHDPIAFVAEPMIGGLCFNLLGSYAVSVMLDVPWWMGLGISMAVWYGGEALLHLVCRWRITSISPLAWLARDLLQPMFMLLAAITGEVRWRGETIKMNVGGRRAPSPD
jgi:ceramide glucosyltransferase